MSLEQMAAITAGLRADTAPLTLHQRRARFEANMGAIPLPPDTTFTPVQIAPHLTGHLTTAPGARTDRVLLWLHGGAFFLGSSHSYRDFAARASAAAGVSVLVPDYRLVPSTPSPPPTTTRSPRSTGWKCRATPPRTSRSAATARAVTSPSPPSRPA